MKDILISQFVDDELDLDEKIEFVETVHGNSGFKNQALDFLNMEQDIRLDAVERIPDLDIQAPRQRSKVYFLPKGILGTGLAAAAAAAIILFFTFSQETVLKSPHRFVLFQPDASQVEISGSFTGWQAMPMQKRGAGGYWETTIDLPEGEHRFSYIIEGRRRIPDPTILVREQDDFGGVNSILEVSSVI